MDTDPIKYWNAQAKDYDDKIFSTIDEDVEGIITHTLDRFACSQQEGPAGRCADFGCGAGKYLQALSARFHSVVACDISPRLVQVATQLAEKQRLSNVSLHVRDLAQSSNTRIAAVGEDAQHLAPGYFGFAVMANVLIAPVPEMVRGAMLRNAWQGLCPGGRLVAIVPSLESCMYVRLRCEEASFSDGPYPSGSAKPSVLAEDLLKGICKRVGVRTKHYLEPEFTCMATRSGFIVESFDKVTFSWKAELGCDYESEVPLSLRSPPLPWDWLFVLRKPGSA